MAANPRSSDDIDGFEVEFERDDLPSNDPQKNATTRGSFRIPQDPDDPITVRIDADDFELSNSSDTGLQVILKNSDQFEPGQPLGSIDVSFSEISLTLKGIVVHVSQIDFDRHVMGVQLVFPDKASQDVFRQHNLKKRKKLFNQ